MLLMLPLQFSRIEVGGLSFLLPRFQCKGGDYCLFLHLRWSASNCLYMGILFSIFLPSERYVIMPYVPLMFVLWPKTEPSQSGKLPFLINMQLFLEHVISDCKSGLFMGQNNSGLAQPR
ncbi:hypothetical protein Taro_039329 [Colocasia esculenta]|uniref:Uncharacterized protein n=1 Tax=Colocasia esculenta TaxID=4460 RepID=A0A843WGD4_COLES|nr:hypothetical protein [Colocasia esculenta]